MIAPSILTSPSPQPLRQTPFRAHRVVRRWRGSDVAYTIHLMNSKKEAARKLAHTARESLAGRMKVAGRVVDRIYNHELKPYGVTISQFGLLSVVLLLEDPTPTQIGEMMSMEKSTLSRNLKLMEQEGWVKLESHGRNLHIQVTRLGCEVYCKSAEGWKRAQVAMKQVLKEEGVDAVQLVASILKSK